MFNYGIMNEQGEIVYVGVFREFAEERLHLVPNGKIVLCDSNLVVPYNPIFDLKK